MAKEESLVNVVNVKMAPELKEVIARQADQEGLPMNELIVRLLARAFSRPDLAVIPRKRMGRPRKQAVA